MMFNFEGKESSQNFSSGSQISPGAHSLDFSGSVAQMDRIIHQRMKTQLPNFHLPETPNENIENELGLCQNFGKMSLDEPRNRGFGINPNEMGFRDFGSSSCDTDLYKHVISLREGCFENRLLGSDFSPKNPHPIFSENRVPHLDNLTMHMPCLNSNVNSVGVFSPSRVLNMDINPVCSDGPMMYHSRGLSVGTNPVSNSPMVYPNRVSSLGNSQQEILNRGPSVGSFVCNNPMLYANQSLGVQNPMCNDLVFNPNRDLCFRNPMLYPKNRDSSVENMVCNTGDLGASSYEDGLILEEKSLKKVAEMGQSSCSNFSRGRKKKPHPENLSQNRRNETTSQNIQGLMCCSLFEFRGYIYFITKDQLGCRFLQSVFDEGNYQDVQIIFNETINHVSELMMDPFANYLIQKLIEVCSDEQLTRIVFMVTARQGELVEISMNTHGTRVVQKLIETLKTRQQKRLVVSALQRNFLELVKNANGYHVIKSCLQNFNKNDTKYMFEAAASCCFEMATHQHGCCILKTCIAQSDGQYHEKLVTEIAYQGFILAQDAFGNYVIQHLIELKVPSAEAILSFQFRGKYAYLSMQKFSSHVIQAFLNSCEKSRPIIIQELISVPRFEQLLQDPFANYVIQTAIDVSKGPLHDLLVKAVRSNSIVRNSPYCKKIFSRKFLKK